jgi:hypothetical protein
MHVLRPSAPFSPLTGWMMWLDRYSQKVQSGGRDEDQFLDPRRGRERETIMYHCTREAA